MCSGDMCFSPTFRGHLVRESSAQWTPHYVPLTRSIKASAPVFAQHKTHKVTNQMNSFWREDLSPQRKLLTAERENPSEPLHVASSVPTRWHLASQMNQLGPYSPVPARAGALASHKAAWQAVSAPEWVFAYHNPGLQAAVCNKTSAFLRHSLFSHRRKRLTYSGRGKFLPRNKGAIQMVPPNLINHGFYSWYFHVPKGVAPPALYWTFEC